MYIEIWILIHYTMNYRTIFWATVLCAALLSCERIENQQEQPDAEAGTYILNNGKWGDNDSNIGIYDPVTKTYTPSAFFEANNRKLGDLGQDILSAGDEVYICVNGSQTVWITDDELKIKDQIIAEAEGARLSPRYLAESNGKVYVSYYEGYVGEISGSAHSVRICPVGPNPEGLAVAGDKLYVAASGGMSYPAYNNTVSVVSLDSFTETDSFEVNVNPTKVEASSNGKYVYISSFGNYADAPAKLQVYNVSTGVVSDLEYSSVSAIAKGANNILYILCGGYDENFNPLPGTVYKHDMASNTALGAFVTDSTTLPNAYSISAGRDGYIYVGCSDYLNTGDIYVFTPEGKLHDSFDSCGMNPTKAY
jgi:hypothetical protein